MAAGTILILSLIILLLPLLGFAINIFWGKRLGRTSSYIATAILGIDLLLAVGLMVAKCFGEVIPCTADSSSILQIFASNDLIQAKLTWIDLGNLQFLKHLTVRIGIGIDNLASLMLIVVTLISFLVHLFSTEYMADDKRYSRYFAYLQLFTFSMLGIVIANNFLVMYIFWELVGISSYLLIGFWYEKDSAANAGKKAFLTNRIGDFGFFAGILVLYLTYGTFMFDELFSSMSNGILPFDSGTGLTIAGVCIFCGAIGKSAQFPLHVWLPDAMEGPTPVSALIHAATMVAAGVYLVARVFPMFTGDALLVIAYIGAITAFMSATIAITQTDFKKVLAYSTVSQLGYMIMGLGVGAYTNGFMHLVTHAWFKACLFLAAGSVIHAMHIALHHMKDHKTDPQDIRNMGGLRKTMPWTYYTFLIATIAIAGVPLTSGFLSKDGILAGTLGFAMLSGHWLIPIAGFAAAGMTAFYMFRLAIISFHGKPTAGENNNYPAQHTKENKFVIVFPLALLAVLSFWLWYSPNPTDATQGWFHSKLPVPASAVPAQYQMKLNLPNEHNAHSETAVQHATATTAGEHNAEAAHSTPAHTATESKSQQNIYAELEHYVHANAHLLAMILSLAIAGGGIFFAFLMYQFNVFNPDSWAKLLHPFYKFSKNKWYVDEIYQASFINGTVGISKVLGYFDLKLIDGLVNLSAWLTKIISYFIGYFDLYVIDGIVNLTAYTTGFFGAAFRKIQTGRVQSYIIFVLLGIIIIAYIFI